MSGIAGVLRLDGGPVDAGDVGMLAAGVAPLGPDGVGRWEGDGVSLIHALLAATPESVGEEQPIVDPATSISVTFDGRLDNRDVLLDLFSRSGRGGPPPTTDAEIVRSAYEHWGPAFAARLLGDFAIALWDGRRRRLICARDPLGVRPLLYRVAGRRIAWASLVKPLANLPGAPTRPNPGMVAEYLASALTSRTDTVYEGVYRLPPAHTLTAEGGSVRLRRYWDLDPAREVRHRSHEDYAEHLRAVLTDAVRARCRTTGPVMAELSGGLDSSLVVGIAQAEARRSGATDVRPLSLVYPGEAADETPWIDAVADLWALDPIKLLPKPAGSFDFFEECRTTAEIPDFPVRPQWGLLYQWATGHGARSVLNGIGGDEWFTGTGWEAADHLRSGHLGRALGRARSAARHEGGGTATAVWRSAVRPLIAGALPASIPSRLRALGAVRRKHWISSGFARSVGLRERLRLTAPTHLRTVSQGQIFYSLNSGNLPAGCEALASFTGRSRLDPRMPLLDVRVVEFALAVPEIERCGNDRPKRLLRSAARGLVPDRLLARTDDPGPGHLMVNELLAPAMAPYLRFSALQEHGWVDVPRLQAAHRCLAEESRAGLPVTQDLLWPLWRAMAVDLWLQATFDR